MSDLEWTTDENRLAIIAAGDLWRSAGKSWCAYCGVFVYRSNKKSDGRGKSKDHVVPRTDGGFKTVPACVACNGRKSTETVEDFGASDWLLQRRQEVKKHAHTQPWSTAVWQAWVNQ